MILKKICLCKIKWYSFYKKYYIVTDVFQQKDEKVFEDSIKLKRHGIWLGGTWWLLTFEF